jgi:hypothetical protein
VPIVTPTETCPYAGANKDEVAKVTPRAHVAFIFLLLGKFRSTESLLSIEQISPAIRFIFLSGTVYIGDFVPAVSVEANKVPLTNKRRSEMSGPPSLMTLRSRCDGAAKTCVVFAGF